MVGVNIMNLANIITVIRIVGTILLLPMNALSTSFLILYTLTGVTDVLDGFIARKTHTESELGAKLDSAADLIFYGTMLYKVFPVLLGVLPKVIVCAIMLIMILRLMLYIFAAIKSHNFMSNHTYLNKLTGFCVFLTPYMMRNPSILTGYGIAACIIAASALIKDFSFQLSKDKCSQ